jgi:hypothetical protein
MVTFLNSDRQREEMQRIREVVDKRWKYIHWGMEGIIHD